MFRLLLFRGARCYTFISAGGINGGAKVVAGKFYRHGRDAYTSIIIASRTSPFTPAEHAGLGHVRIAGYSVLPGLPNAKRPSGSVDFRASLQPAPRSHSSHA